MSFANKRSGLLTPKQPGSLLVKLTAFLLSSLEAASGTPTWFRWQGSFPVPAGQCRQMTRSLTLMLGPLPYKWPCPALAPQLAVAFWFPAGVLCVERTDSVGSPQHLAFFLGPKPDSSSPEQLVPGTLTVLSPRKSLF